MKKGSSSRRRTRPPFISRPNTPSTTILNTIPIRKVINEQMATDKDPLSRKYMRYHSGKKGKSIGLNDKVKSAGVGDWKDQKLSRLSFFETQRSLFLDANQIEKAFKDVEVDYQRLDEKYLDYDEGAFPRSLGTEGIRYAEQMGQELEVVYLANGLPKEEVELRRKTYGPNSLPEKKKTPGIILFLLEISNYFSILLWLAAALSFVGYGLDSSDMSNLWLAIVIILIILLTGIFSYFQNEKSGEIMDSFKSFNNTIVTVTREGIQQNISAIEIVKGDVVHIKTGEKIPADLRLFVIEGDLQLDNSPLTGESIACSASRECGEKGKDNALEAKNLAFFSTNCKEGRGTGVCIRIGSETFMGKIADLASSAEAQATTLEREINRFIKIIASVAVFLGVLFFILGIIIGYDIITDFIFALGIIVANCPEGLLSTVTVSLAITAKKMLKRNVMVKNLQSVETLGAITCICSDKTGTLTKNKMTVVHVFYDGEIKKTSDSQKNLRNENNEEIPMDVFEFSDVSFPIFQFTGVCGSVGDFLTTTPEDYLPVVQERNKWQKDHPLAQVSQINEQTAKLKVKFQDQYTKEYNTNVDERYTNTDASESGIIKFFEKIEPINKIREKFPLHTVGPESQKISIPFNSDLKYACFLRRSEADGTFLLAMKGAPERILLRCSKYLYKGSDKPITQKFREKFVQANQAFALKGERVIGLAYKKYDPQQYPLNYPFSIEKEDKKNQRKKGSDPVTNFPLTDLTFVGLVAMEDPPRDGVREAIQLCKQAGIKVIMVTGDQSLTAASIAHQIGIITDIDDTPELIQRREKLESLEEAETKSNTIIIEGGRLQAYLDRDSTMSDDNPNKNSFLRNWLMKRDVVFARTSPENKLCIVNACQSLSHVVAVTGDGVNDSPAIKKADIGIAMGKVGTDVAKDAADILLLDDHFPNILKGVKQGRVIFDTLKKIIGYNLSSNIPELFPFLGMVILRFPLALTTLLVLCIDVGTDIMPNICQAYEAPERGLMLKKPRNVKVDKLCTLKLFSYGYLFMGVSESFGCFLAYFVVLNDFGFRPYDLFDLAFATGIEPANQDYYNPYDQFYGNSRAFISENSDLLGLYGESFAINVAANARQPKWTGDSDVNRDLRLFFPSYPESYFGDCKYDSRGQGYDDYVCYRIEAVRHAQGAYLLAVVILQISNAFVWRTKISSVYKHKLNNHLLHFAFVVEMALMMIILYVPSLNTAFGTRPLRIEHYFPCLGFHIVLFFWGEMVKALIRNSRKPDGSPGFFDEYFNY